MGGKIAQGGLKRNEEKIQIERKKGNCWKRFRPEWGELKHERGT